VTVDFRQRCLELRDHAERELPLAFNTSATAQEQDFYKDYDNSSGYSWENASYSVSNVALAWPQPQVSVN